MYHAASALFEVLMRECDPPQNVLILCGGGGNGGDGYVLAQLFSTLSCNVFLCNLAGEIRSPDSLYYHDVAQNINSIRFISSDRLGESVFGYDLIIDAVFGIGFHGELPDSVAAVFEFAKNSEAVKVAVDVPSGVYCDDAGVAEGAFCADLTVTFEFYKPCHVCYPAKEFCGEVVVVPIGFSDEAIEGANSDGILLGGEILSFLKEPVSPQSHKGDLGRLLSVTGSRNMTGAVYLSSMAALRGGIGLLYIACEYDILDVLQQKLNEPVFLPYKHDFIEAVGDLSRYDVILHGCGSDTKRPDITRHLIECSSGPLILDADALNNIANDSDMLSHRKGQVVLTPHPLEMARLCCRTVEEVQSNRISTAREFARNSDCIVVLKGAASVIASPDGRYAINPTGNPGMAKGGSGDVLAGLIAAFCTGRSHKDLFTAVSAAVYMHGLVGDRCAESMSWRSMLPSDMLNQLVSLLK